ncbi:hypothetical protein [Pseudofrankia sp. BMG5.36]|uniref:hypothetical protein n=1 Tax=Pseudofrankia sp. BMG5.36 TaxID=1834512 RepID=UPI0008D9061E|nr:hypothetical protein [Pseudofrankia sp. BMG5.36]OHV49321.1 hypothetical protein BCD48_12750 [Pseudofrankia sp. BMG5.36]
MLRRNRRDDRDRDEVLDPKGRVTPWGEPLTKADGRVYDLRDSGYKGWVEWKVGDRVSDAEVDAQMGKGFSAKLRATHRQDGNQ